VALRRSLGEDAGFSHCLNLERKPPGAAGSDLGFAGTVVAGLDLGIGAAEVLASGSGGRAGTACLVGTGLSVGACREISGEGGAGAGLVLAEVDPSTVVSAKAGCAGRNCWTRWSFSCSDATKSPGLWTSEAASSRIAGLGEFTIASVFGTD